MLIDAHFHSWQIARADYGWLTPALAPIYRDVNVPDWQGQAKAVGVTGGILVQAAPTEAETVHLLALADQHPSVLGVVGWVDWLAPDAAQRIQALARHPRLKGLRPMLQDIPDPVWILQPALQPLLALMAELGLVFDALVKPVHLPRLLTLAQRHPSLSIVIDHAAKPDIAAGTWQPWADDVQRLAEQTNAVCKLSGMVTEAGANPVPQVCRPWADHVLACFGPDRVLWGSDWPVLELAGSYAGWWQACQQFTEHLTEAERAAVFGGNALRVYRVDVVSLTS
jgi:L-fuconolactonase